MRPFACIFEQYWRRTLYVTGWNIGRIHSARQPKRLSIADRHSAVLLAATQRHDGDSLGRSHGTGMPAARLHAMAVGYQYGVDRQSRISPAVHQRAIETKRVSPDPKASSHTPERKRGLKRKSMTNILI